MLAKFLRTNRAAILDRASAQLSKRAGPVPTEEEVREGVPLFLDQLGLALDLAESRSPRDGAAMMQIASRHGEALHRIGLTIGQVVQEYGEVCQSIAELAVQQRVPISPTDFQTLNLCLDEAISGAVTSYARNREEQIAEQTNERVGTLAHEMRNHLHTAILTYESIRTGLVPVSGSTGRIHLRSLQAMQAVIDRTLADVRLDAGHIAAATILVREFLEEVSIGATIEARERGVHFVVQRPEDRSLAMVGDRQILAGALANLLQNAFKFTPAEGTVTLSARASYDRVHFDVADECGGLPAGKAETLFLPFEQGSADRSGLGLGLAISRKAAHANHGTVNVRDVPGTGCVFTLDLPRKAPPVPGV